MGKVLMWLVLGLLGWLLYRATRLKAQRMSTPPEQAPDSDASPGDRQLPQAETMLRCARCGVFFPASDALRRGADAYCSAAHRDGA